MTICFAPILPYPKRSGNVHGTFGYNLVSTLPYIQTVDLTTFFSSRIDTIWGVEGMTYRTQCIIPPTALYCHEYQARCMLDEIIFLHESC